MITQDLNTGKTPEISEVGVDGSFKLFFVHCENVVNYARTLNILISGGQDDFGKNLDLIEKVLVLLEGELEQIREEI